MRTLDAGRIPAKPRLANKALLCLGISAQQGWLGWDIQKYKTCAKDGKHIIYLKADITAALKASGSDLLL